LYGLNVLMPTNIVSIKLLSRKNVHAENFLCPPLKTFSDRLLAAHEGPLRGCSLLDSLRKGRFRFFMPSPTAESGFNDS
jgi:hypothetical protein